MDRRIAALAFGWALLLPVSAAAQGNVPFQCGPDCSSPGRYVLCNDTFDTSARSAGGIVLEGFLDAACTSFQAPAGSFDVVGFAALFGAGDMVISLLQLFVESGVARPGDNLLESGVGIQGAGAPSFTGIFFNATPMTADFRICIKQQVEDLGQTMFGRPLFYDDDGMQAQNNLFVPGSSWQNAADNNITGDFILRAIVTTADRTPWEPGGICDRTGRDGGVPPSPRDGGPGNPGRDAGFANTPDAGSADMDAGTVDPGGPPTITAISPNKGVNTTPVSVIVTGTNFVTGLSLKIGTIVADEVKVPGPTTIMATVPANIAVGVYDVIVTNPDAQAAILPSGYTVLGEGGGGAPVAETCGCTTTKTTKTGSSAWLGLLLLWVARRRRT